MPHPDGRGHRGATSSASVAIGSPASAGAIGATSTVVALSPGTAASTTTCGPGDIPAVANVDMAPVTSG